MSRQPKKPRDCGLLLWTLLYRVPVTEALTPERIEEVRKRCRMSPERLAELQNGPIAIHWHRMVAKRARRYAHYQKFGNVPDGWTPPLPGEPDNSKQVAAMRNYWKIVAPMRAKARKTREGRDVRFWPWIATKLHRSRNIKNPAKRRRVLDALEARLVERIAADKLSPSDSVHIEMLKEADHARRARKKF